MAENYVLPQLEGRVDIIYQQNCVLAHFGNVVRQTRNTTCLISQVRGRMLEAIVTIKLECTMQWVNYKLQRDSAVGIATGYGLDDRGVGVRVPVGSRIFSSPRRPDWFLGPTQSPIQWIPGALSLGVKRQGREVDHLPPASAEVKKTWTYTCTPHTS
jgi:hypothetical protein